MQPKVAHKQAEAHSLCTRHIPTRIRFLVSFLAIETNATSCSPCLQFILFTHLHEHTRKLRWRLLSDGDYYIVVTRFSRPDIHTPWHTSANWKRCMQRFWSRITVRDRWERARTLDLNNDIHTYPFDAIVFQLRLAAAAAAAARL